MTTDWVPNVHSPTTGLVRCQILLALTGIVLAVAAYSLMQYITALTGSGSLLTDAIHIDTSKPWLSKSILAPPVGNQDRHPTI